MRPMVTTRKHHTTMVTRILLPLLVAATCATSNLQAAEPATPLPARMLNAQERELRRQIDRFVSYPLLRNEVTMDGDVYVSFVVDREGRIEVVDAHGDNAALCEYVLRRLAQVDIGENPDGTWRTTHMRFTFGPEA